MSNDLLVVIDPQNDFINKEGYYAKKHSGIDQILNAKDKINKLIALGGNANLVVIYSNYKENQFEEGLAICIPDTNGHKIDIDIHETHVRISKTDLSCFSSEEFTQYLKTKNINRLILCGFLAEYCVKQTALDALDKGYSISLLKDCIGTGDDVQNRKEQMLCDLIKKGAEVVNSNF